MKISKNERIESGSIFKFNEEQNAYVFLETVFVREAREERTKQEIKSERKSERKDKDYIAFKKRQKLLSK